MRDRLSRLLSQLWAHVPQIAKLTLRSLWDSVRIPDDVAPVPERNAFEAVCKLVLALWLLPVAASGDVPKTLADSPTWMSVGSPWAVVIGCALALCGLSLRDREAGIDLQQVGIVLVGCGLAIYGTALLTSGSPTIQTRYAAGVLFAVSLGCAARWWQLQRREIAKHRRLLEAIRSQT